MGSGGILFDLDGTLVDTLETIGRVVNRALESLDHPTHSLEAYRTMVGEGIHVLCSRALPEADERQRRLLLERARHFYALHRSDGAQLYPGIPELLDALGERGARLAVLSNKPDELTHGTLEDLGVHGRFHCVLGQREEIPRKPDPAGVDWILERLGAERTALWFVGDTAIDVETARAAGIPSIGVTWGFRGRDELLEAGATVLVDHPEEILERYDRGR